MSVWCCHVIWIRSHATHIISQQNHIHWVSIWVLKTPPSIINHCSFIRSSLFIRGVNERLAPCSNTHTCHEICMYRINWRNPCNNVLITKAIRKRALNDFEMIFTTYKDSKSDPRVISDWFQLFSTIFWVYNIYLRSDILQYILVNHVKPWKHTCIVARSHTVIIKCWNNCAKPITCLFYRLLLHLL